MSAQRCAGRGHASLTQCAACPPQLTPRACLDRTCSHNPLPVPIELRFEQPDAPFLLRRPGFSTVTRSPASLARSRVAVLLLLLPQANAQLTGLMPAAAAAVTIAAQCSTPQLPITAATAAAAAAGWHPRFCNGVAVTAHAAHSRSCWLGALLLAGHLVVLLGVPLQAGKRWAGKGDGGERAALAWWW